MAPGGGIIDSVPHTGCIAAMEWATPGWAQHTEVDTEKVVRADRARCADEDLAAVTTRFR